MIIPKSTIERNIDEVFQTVPKALWKKRASKLLRSWPNLRVFDFIQERYAIELGLGEIAGLHDFRSAYGPQAPSAIHIEGMQFAHLVSRLASLSGRRDRLGKLIKGSLNPQTSLRPFRFELDTLQFGQGRGFDVQPMDFTGAGRFDYLFTKADVSIAVECKHITGDAGMLIEKRQALDLFDRVVGHLKKTRVPLIGLDIRISVPGRLPNAEALFSQIKSALNRGENVDTALCSVELGRMSAIQIRDIEELQASVDNTELKHRAVNDVLGIDRSNHMLVMDDGRGLFSIALKSRAATNAPDRIFERLLEDSFDQLPHDIPSAIMVELADLAADDREFFVPRNPGDDVRNRVIDLFERRPWLCGITFVAGQRNGRDVQWVTSHGNDRPTLVFRNPNHPKAEDSVVKSLF